MRPPPQQQTARLRVKRALDVGAATVLLAGILPFAPALLLAQLAIHGWPLFFVQERPGKGGKIFRLYKLRTMTNARDASGALLPDDQRLTRFGRWLRTTSLDELPELINVLRGEMSLVGPRPLLPQYLARYSKEQARRHEVTPGITGWAQVHGRNGLGWEEKLELDVWYVDNWSLTLDAEILLRTVLVVFRGDGVSARGHATAPEFMGAEAPGQAGGEAAA